ncbi:MAG: outer membrane protein assembly factor BamD [Gallionellaceae bacterium]|jgi:outer membrane protein assembly factor BamD
MRYSLYVFLILTLTACSTTPDDKTFTAEQLYSEAMESLDDHNYEQAVKKFEKLQSRYPYGRFAQQAQMEIAYAYYKQSEPAPALSAINRFIKQYPNNAHVDYMYYLKGLINFDENLGGLMNKITRQDPAERDPKSLHDSFNAFKELVSRFPNSDYAPDARLRMQYLLNTLAGSDIYVANYYLRRGAYVAALNRAKNVLTDYPNSPQTLEALNVMIKAYEAMGMTDLRDDTRRILNLNSKISLANQAPEKSLNLPNLDADSAVSGGVRP